MSAKQINELLKRVEALEKADINVAVGGQLLPDQALAFIDTVKEENAFMSSVTTIPMSVDTHSIDLIDIAARQTQSDVEGSDSGTTADATMPRRTLSLVPIKMKFDITLHWVQQNIEGEGGQAKVEAAFAKAFGNDQQDLGANGDDGDADPFIALNDGWVTIAQADANTNKYTNTTTAYHATAFPAMVDALPEKYRDTGVVKFLVSPAVFTAYLRELKSLGFSVSDQAIQGNAVAFEGYEVIPVRYWPTNFPFLCDPANLHFGVSTTGMRFDLQWESRPGVWQYTLRFKTDYEYAISEAIVSANLS